jgi:hypothetical protein
MKEATRNGQIFLIDASEGVINESKEKNTYILMPLLYMRKSQKNTCVTRGFL